MDYQNKKASELASLFLNGDRNVTLKMIKDAETKERFLFCLEKASFGKDILKPLVILPVTFYCIFLD